MIRGGARKGTFRVTEQLRLQQLLRNGGAVDGSEAPLVPGAHPMDRAGNDLFPVPLSPVISTVVLWRATRAASSSTSRMP